MKKILLTLMFAFGSMLLYAQNQRTINTEDGLLTIKTDAVTLKDYIEFSVSEWNNNVQGTKYTVNDASPSIAITVCIIIANRKKKDCSGGIGFRCGFIECPPPVQNRPETISNGQHADRIYSASYSKNGNIVVLKFNEKVDWDWLAN